jgi:Defence against restriction A C-terminal
MKLQAAQRLRADDLEQLTYAQYQQVISSIDPSYIVAFEFKIPEILKGLKADVMTLIESLKDVGIGMGDVITAFKEKSVFKLLKGVGFSLYSLLKGVKAFLGIPGNALANALKDLSETFKDVKYLKSLKVSERLEMLEDLIKRHPVLKKLTGIAIAGLLLLMVFKAANIGHVDKDLDVVESIIDALHGNFSLADMFASADGVLSIATLIFGWATGASALDYGLGALQKIAHYIDDNTGSLLLCLFYTAAKKLKLKFAKSAPTVLKSNRTQDWLSSLPHEEKHAYLQKYPGSKFRDKTKILHPSEIEALKVSGKKARALTEASIKVLASTEFWYCMVNRPVGLGTCPKGFTEVKPRPERGSVHYEMARHGLVGYPQPLTDQETRAFEMAPAIEASDEKSMSHYADIVISSFGEYAKDYVEDYSGSELEQEVWDKLKSGCKGYPPSLDLKALALLVVKKINAI